MVLVKDRAGHSEIRNKKRERSETKGKILLEEKFLDSLE